MGVTWYKGFPGNYDGFITTVKYIINYICGEQEALPPVISNPTFDLDFDQDEDYRNNLDPSLYIPYKSGIDKFSFYYPSQLYKHIETNLNHEDTEYGTNIATITFFGNRGSRLTYFICQRTSNEDPWTALDLITAKESQEIEIDFNDVKSGNYYTEESEATVSITGRNNKHFILYKHIMVTETYIMILRIESPDYKDEEDEMAKRYVHECIYRYCGFRNKYECLT